MLANNISLSPKTDSLLVGFLAYWALLFAAIGWSVKSGLVVWPFFGRQTSREVYQSLLLCIPLFFLSSLALVWLKLAHRKILDFFKWRTYSHVFMICLGISIWFSMYLYSRHEVNFRQWTLWPVVLIFSICNAYAEEVIYRLVLLRLLIIKTKNKIFSVFFQSGFYAFPHYFIGGTTLAILAFLYGILLGFVALKNESVLPSIVCHFAIDIGYIGVPFFL